MNEPKKYQFNIQIQAPGINQNFSIQIAEDQMQCCPCGHDLFSLNYRVTHIKPALIDPRLFGMPQQLVATPVYVCSKCGYEVTPTNPTKAEALESQNVSA